MLGVETVQGDLRDVDLAMVVCHGMDAVFHAAAVAGIWGKWENYHSINTEATKNIVAGCLRHLVR